MSKIAKLIALLEAEKTFKPKREYGKMSKDPFKKLLSDAKSAEEWAKYLKEKEKKDEKKSGGTMGMFEILIIMQIIQPLIIIYAAMQVIATLAVK